MNKFPSKLLLVIGLITTLLGFVYMVVFFDLPYPDTMTEEIATQSFHKKVTFMIIGIGFCGLFVGLVGGVAKFIYKIFKKTK